MLPARLVVRQRDALSRRPSALASTSAAIDALTRLADMPPPVGLTRSAALTAVLPRSEGRCLSGARSGSIFWRGRIQIGDTVGEAERLQVLIQ